MIKEKGCGELKDKIRTNEYSINRTFNEIKGPEHKEFNESNFGTVVYQDRSLQISVNA